MNLPKLWNLISFECCFTIGSVFCAVADTSERPVLEVNWIDDMAGSGGREKAFGWRDKDHKKRRATFFLCCRWFTFAPCYVAEERLGWEISILCAANPRTLLEFIDFCLLLLASLFNNIGNTRNSSMSRQKRQKAPKLGLEWVTRRKRKEKCEFRSRRESQLVCNKELEKSYDDERFDFVILKRFRRFW